MYVSSHYSPVATWQRMFVFKQTRSSLRCCLDNSGGRVGVSDEPQRHGHVRERLLGGWQLITSPKKLTSHP